MDSSKTGSVRRCRTPEQRQRLVTRFHQSQLTQRDFAARHGIGLSTLSKWLRLERDVGPAKVKFHEVRLPNPTPRWLIEVASPQGWIVRLQNSSEVQALPQLLRAPPCGAYRAPRVCWLPPGPWICAAVSTGCTVWSSSNLKRIPCRVIFLLSPTVVTTGSRCCIGTALGYGFVPNGWREEDSPGRSVNRVRSICAAKSSAHLPTGWKYTSKPVGIVGETCSHEFEQAV